MTDRDPSSIMTEVKKIIVHSAAAEVATAFLQKLSDLWPEEQRSPLTEQHAGPAHTLSLSLQYGTQPMRWQWSALVRGQELSGVRQLFYRRVNAVLFLVDNDLDALSPSLAAGRRLIDDLVQAQITQVPLLLGYYRAKSMASAAPLSYLQSLFNATTPPLPFYELDAATGVNFFAVAERLMRSQA